MSRFVCQWVSGSFPGTHQLPTLYEKLVWLDWKCRGGEGRKNPKRTSVLYRQACIFVCEGVSKPHSKIHLLKTISIHFFLLIYSVQIKKLQSIYNRNVIRFWIRRETNRFTAPWNFLKFFGGLHCIWRYGEAQGVQEVQKNTFGKYSTEGIPR